MTTNIKLMAGNAMPAIEASDERGTRADICAPGENADWRLLVVYRGVHCPLCTKYLNELEGYRDPLQKLAVDVIAVSADTPDQLARHREKLTAGFPLYCELDVESMQALGLYISEPRSAKETDHLFPEPGVFIIDAERRLRIVDISNNPFVRPDLETLIKGIAFLKDPANDYPIRGTYSAQA